MLEKTPKTKKTDEPVVVKKYANRRLYNTETSTYVTLEDLAAMVRSERDFVVYDAKSGQDLTHGVLTQIIVEQESRPGGNPMLPIPFLRQLIRFYGKGIERMVPSYLQVSLESLAREQDRFTQQFTSAFSSSPFEAYQEQARKNIEMFEKAMAVFSPFTGGMPPGGKAGDETATCAGDQQSADAAAKAAAAAQATATPQGRQSSKAGPAMAQRDNADSDDSAASKEELARVKSQLDDMQKMLDKLSKR